MPVTPASGKLQGFKSQFSYTAPGGSTPLQFKSLQNFDLDVTAKEIDASDHDSAGWEDTLTGLAKWKGTVKGVYFEGDPTQTGIFDAMVAGLTGVGDIACVFYPQKGTVSDGTLKYTGTAVVVGYKHGSDQNGVQTLDLTISGRGPLLRVAQ